MKKRLLAGIVGGFLALSTGAVLAQPYGHMPPPQAQRAYNIQSRIGMQQKQIQHGMRTGQLNRREAAVVRDNLNQVKHEYNRSKRDGRLDRVEMARLDGMLDRNEHMIRRMNGNDIRRF